MISLKETNEDMRHDNSFFFCIFSCLLVLASCSFILCGLSLRLSTSMSSAYMVSLSFLISYVFSISLPTAYSAHEAWGLLSCLLFTCFRTGKNISGTDWDRVQVMGNNGNWVEWGWRDRMGQRRSSAAQDDWFPLLLLVGGIRKG